MTRWGAYVDQRIDDLRYGKGREDWDGEWPSLAAVNAAWVLACEVFREETPTPSVVPTADGEVAFIWRRNGLDAEVAVWADGAEVWVHDRESGEMWSGSIADHRRCCVKRLLDRLDGAAAQESALCPARLGVTSKAGPRPGGPQL